MAIQRMSRRPEIGLLRDDLKSLRKLRIARVIRGILDFTWFESEVDLRLKRQDMLNLNGVFLLTDKRQVL